MGQIVNPTGYLGNYNKANGSFTQMTNPPLDDYTLQLNSNVWQYSRMCGGILADPSCYAWQQFVYDSTSNKMFMQSWLLGYVFLHRGKCPSGWNFSDDDCFHDSARVGPIKFSDKKLINARLEATVNTDKNTMTFEFTDGAKTVHDITDVDALGLGIPVAAGGNSPGSGWIQVEFNIFGAPEGGPSADFLVGTVVGIDIKARPYNGATASKCITRSETAETNSMILRECIASATGISFNEIRPAD